MQVIHPDLLGDSGDQFLAAEPSFGIRKPVDDRPCCLERKGRAAIDLPEFEYFSSTELIGESLQFKKISPTSNAGRGMSLGQVEQTVAKEIVGEI